MCQLVAHKRLKTMKNYNAVTSKSGRGCLREVPTRFLTGNNLMFWISGRLWRVVAHGGSTVFDFGCLDLIEINFAVCHCQPSPHSL